MFSDVRIEKLLQQAEARKQEAHDAEETGKLRVLRGGNSGCVTEDGEQYGKCSRVSLLRFLGISAPIDDRAPFFFAAGHANEATWTDLLGSVWTGRVLAEEEIPIAWSIPHPTTGEKVPVTGRPDVVLCDDEGTPVVGCELKKVCSSYRAVKAFLGVEADPEHLVQAAHYSWKLGKLPWILSYTSDSSYDTPYWAIKKYGAERKIQPGRQHFYLGWQGDKFCFINPVGGNLVETKITGAGIERYYQSILEMEATKILTERPATDPVYPGGADPDPCRYCTFAGACDKYEDRSFDQWLDAAKSIAATGIKENEA